GTLDIGMASRPISPEEKDKIPNVKEHAVGKDGIAIIVSKTLYEEGLTGLTQEEVKDIYSGDITNWKEVGGPDEDTYVVERADTSGTYGVFMNLMGLEETAADSTQPENADVQRTVAGSDYAIGYVGMGYIQDDAPAVKLDGADPTFGNVADESYPLFRELYMYTDGEPEGGTAEFLDFVMGERGQEIVEEEGFVPLNA
ncbi:MAG: phosphate ABC transporter substrate-binding protein, partial [Candidatus Natronoplasma sp.]